MERLPRVMLNLDKEQVASFWMASLAVEVKKIYLTALTEEKVFTIVSTVKMLEFSVPFQVTEHTPTLYLYQAEN